ncbi:MAG: hypothetical protein ACOCWQ_03005 [Nanoarchaeota archaeon]
MAIAGHPECTSITGDPMLLSDQVETSIRIPCQAESGEYLRADVVMGYTSPDGLPRKASGQVSVQT